MKKQIFVSMAIWGFYVCVCFFWFLIWRDTSPDITLSYIAIRDFTVICLAISVGFLWCWKDRLFHYRYTKFLYLSIVTGIWNVGRFPTFNSVTSGVISSSDGFQGVPLTGFLASIQFWALFWGLCLFFLFKKK